MVTVNAPLLARGATFAVLPLFMLGTFLWPLSTAGEASASMPSLMKSCTLVVDIVCP